MSGSADPQIVHDPVFRHRLRFSDTTDERGNPAVLCEMWVDPGGGVPPHVHPHMEERFTVVEGRMQFLAGRRWADADAVATVLVPAGTRHAYRNRGDVVAYTRCVATPPDPGLEGFLTDAAVMSRAGRMTRAGIPKGATGWLQGAVLLDAYGDMVEMSFPPAPPRFLQRLLMPPLARLARRRGIRAGHFA
ncbi:MAG: cupin domain-containing protein [Conexibacter sp.]